MYKKLLLVMLLPVGAIISFSSLAAPNAQQLRENFETKMVQPCEGKKVGDEVTITGRNGDQITAICTLTAIPKTK